MRHSYSRFIERTIEHTSDFLDLPEAADYLGDYLPMLQNSLKQVVICTTDQKGVVIAPKAAQSTDAILVTPQRAGQSLLIGSDFMNFSPTQRENLRNKLATLVSTDRIDQEVTELEELLAIRGSIVNTGMSVSPAWVNARSSRFSLTPGQYPGSGRLLGTIHARPLLGIQIPNGNRPTGSPLDVMHELVHVNQIIREPIVLHDSHEAAEMHQWGQELEAYHVGAIGAALRKEVGNRKLIHDPWGTAALQTAVETARAAHNTPEYPFAVDHQLVNKIYGLTVLWADENI